MNVPVREETITSTMKKVSRKAYFSVGLTHFTRLQSAPAFFFRGACKPITEESSHKVHRRRGGKKKYYFRFALKDDPSIFLILHSEPLMWPRNRGTGKSGFKRSLGKKRGGGGQSCVG